MYYVIFPIDHTIHTNITRALPSINSTARALIQNGCCVRTSVLVHCASVRVSLCAYQPVRVWVCRLFYATLPTNLHKISGLETVEHNSVGFSSISMPPFHRSFQLNASTNSFVFIAHLVRWYMCVLCMRFDYSCLNTTHIEHACIERRSGLSMYVVGFVIYRCLRLWLWL